MNFLPATVTADGHGVVLPGGQRVATPRAAGLGGRSVLAGIRPEHLTLDGPADPEHRLEVAVELVEALGADTVLHGRLGDGTTLLARLPGVAPVRDGDRLAFAVPEDQLHLFDPDTGPRAGLRVEEGGAGAQRPGRHPDRQFLTLSGWSARP